MPIIFLCISFQVLASLEDEEDINEVRAVLDLNLFVNILLEEGMHLYCSYCSGLSVQ